MSKRCSKSFIRFMQWSPILVGVQVVPFVTPFSPGRLTRLIWPRSVIGSIILLFNSWSGLSENQEPKHFLCRQVIHPERIHNTRFTAPRDCYLLLRRAHGSPLRRCLRISGSNIFRKLSAKAVGDIKYFFNLIRASLFTRLQVQHWVIDVPRVLEVIWLADQTTSRRYVSIQRSWINRQSSARLFCS